MKRINIQVTIDVALDSLSVLQIKYNQAQDPEIKQKLAAAIIEIENRIVKGIGFKTYQRIIGSEEYSQLYDKNYEVFMGIELAKNDVAGELISGYELDLLNTKRSAAKRNLFGKFCGGESEEVKIKDGKAIN